MSMINTEMYEALLSAGAAEDKARRAAETVIEKNQLATKHDIELVRSEINNLRLLTIGVGLAIVVDIILSFIN